MNDAGVPLKYRSYMLQADNTCLLSWLGAWQSSKMFETAEDPQSSFSVSGSFHWLTLRTIKSECTKLASTKCRSYDTERGQPWPHDGLATCPVPPPTPTPPKRNRKRTDDQNTA